MAEPNLELLQTMVQRVLDVLGRHGDRLWSIEARLTAIEKHMAGLHHVVASGTEDTANVNARLDGLARRVERIERRLDLGRIAAVRRPATTGRPRPCRSAAA